MEEAAWLAVDRRAVALAIEVHHVAARAQGRAHWSRIYRPLKIASNARLDVNVGVIHMAVAV